ncbi:cAMP-activated global transcriptional regulator CRP [Andreprevotia sp. IGB-42]|uniref:cyclic nucleotide-binding domain-containing protein n=1 Tax=Andreprevotia sp. IGB-42 TaxID=2497473 RepID=UPI00135BB748|nr:cyclic nucleotide-binding domain-containing protein [Andreprevotia sp. IGB-42]KAF0814183.1 cAMP-activated global transcriptional regulator CRP [Andreprevotia sp. IGB-42]
MSLTSFFDYGAAGGDADAEPALVFLGQASTEDWRQLLSVAEQRRFSAGDMLILAGEQTRAFYIVAEGELEVLADFASGKPRRLTTIGRQSIFGEQAFFDGQARSASVRALQAGQLYGISPDAFELLAGRQPELARRVLFDLGRILSLRLRSMTGNVLGVVRKP